MIKVFHYIGRFALFACLFLLFASDSYAQTPGAFITTWDTTNPGNSATDTISFNFPSNRGAITNVVVDWGDNSTSSYPTPGVVPSHTYSVPGVYTVEITGPMHQLLLNGDPEKILSVEQWGDNVWGIMASMFLNASNVVINASDSPDLTNVTSMARMFEAATSFNQDISAWDVSNVSSMNSLFSSASSFNQDLSDWDVSAAINISLMFTSATSFNQDISAWDVSNVTNMTGMFQGATAFDQDLSDWDVSGITVFYGEGGGFLTSSGISDSNYSKLIVQWAALPSLGNGAGLGTVPAQYYSTAQSSRDILTGTYNWSISDDGSIPAFTLVYLPGTNASLVGEGTQDVASGGNGNSVTVTPDRGYSFVEWSDGNRNNPRTDSNVLGDVSVTASLRSNSRSGGHVVRILENRAQKELERQNTSSTTLITTVTSRTSSQERIAQMTAFATQHPREFLEKAMLLLAALTELLELLTSTGTEES